MSKGFFLTGVFQLVSNDSTGASWTGSAFSRRLARAMPAACVAIRAISSLRHVAAAREAPRPVHDHAHAKAVVLGVDDVLDAAVAGEDELVAVAVDADVGVARAGLLGGRERRIREIAQLGVRGIAEEHRHGPRTGGRPKHEHGLDELTTVDHRKPLRGARDRKTPRAYYEAYLSADRKTTNWRRWFGVRDERADLRTGSPLARNGVRRGQTGSDSV